MLLRSQVYWICLLRHISDSASAFGPIGGAMARDRRIEVVQRAVGVEHAQLDARHYGASHVLGYSHVHRHGSNAHDGRLKSRERTLNQIPSPVFWGGVSVLR